MNLLKGTLQTFEQMQLVTKELNFHASLANMGGYTDI